MPVFRELEALLIDFGSWAGVGQPCTAGDPFFGPDPAGDATPAYITPTLKRGLRTRPRL